VQSDRDNRVGLHVSSGVGRGAFWNVGRSERAWMTPPTVCDTLPGKESANVELKMLNRIAPFAHGFVVFSQMALLVLAAHQPIISFSFPRKAFAVDRGAF
jgi:hypothetical protein